MANLIKSVEDTYTALSAAAFPSGTTPPISLTTAPLVTALGAAQRLPYVVCSLASGAEEQGFESDLETTHLVFTAYANGAGNAQQIVAAIRFNGQAPAAAAGFDNATALAGFTDGALVGVFPEGPPEVEQDRAFDGAGATVHRGTMRYRVVVERA